MKLFSFMAILFLIMTVSIPSSFRDMKVFGSDMSVSLDDYQKSDQQSDDAEEEEVQIYFSVPLSTIVLTPDFSSEIAYPPLKVFLSSYTFSIFVPPLA